MSDFGYYYPQVQVYNEFLGKLIFSGVQEMPQLYLWTLKTTKTL